MTSKGFTLFTIFCFFIAPAVLGGLPSGGIRAADLAEIKKLDEEVLSQKKKIDRVQEGIERHQIRVKQSRAREQNLLAELDKINAQIEAEEKKLAILQAAMAEQDQLTLEKERETERVLREKETLQHHMEKRLAAYYRMGDIGIMNVFFSAATLPELLSFRENFHLMLKYDREVIIAFKEKMKELEAARRAHQQEKQRLILAAAKVEEQREVLAEVQMERRILLERVKTEKKLYQQAIREMEAAAEELAATLIELQDTARQAKREREEKLIREHPLKPFKKRKPASYLGFAGEKGKLPLPAAGAILQKFGTHTDENFGVSTFINGIDIETAPGTEVIAVYEGKVVYAGILRGYGKLVIIDHGNHYYSLTSGLGEIRMEVGDKVRQGEVIALSSQHTGLLREGLHFEIRHNTEAQDPLKWLDPTKISVKTR